jgi:hypothetical protein
MANKTYSAWDFIQFKLRQQQADKLPTKKKFGELMHDEELEEDEKLAIAERVLEAGGYDVLQDDNQ